MGRGTILLMSRDWQKRNNLQNEWRALPKLRKLCRPLKITYHKCFLGRGQGPVVIHVEGNESKHGKVEVDVPAPTCSRVVILMRYTNLTEVRPEAATEHAT